MNSSTFFVYFDVEPREKIRFVDPYDSIWLKIATFVVYTIEILASDELDITVVKGMIGGEINWK